MNAATFTPGPWQSEHRKKPDGMWNTEVFCAKGETIAVVAWYPMPETEAGVTGTYREGNASLIAAAPDLLEACKQQHRAIDLLMARLIALDPTFMPTKSGAWDVVVSGRNAISKATGST